MEIIQQILNENIPFSTVALTCAAYFFVIYLLLKKDFTLIKISADLTGFLILGSLAYFGALTLKNTLLVEAALIILYIFGRIISNAKKRAEEKREEGKND